LTIIPLTWDASQIIIEILSLVVSACVHNLFFGHCLFYDVLHATITMTLKLKKKIWLI
jgi:hypothetical protein